MDVTENVTDFPIQSPLTRKHSHLSHKDVHQMLSSSGKHSQMPNKK